MRGLRDKGVPLLPAVIPRMTRVDGEMLLCVDTKKQNGRAAFRFPFTDQAAGHRTLKQEDSDKNQSGVG